MEDRRLLNELRRAEHWGSGAAWSVWGGYEIEGDFIRARPGAAHKKIYFPEGRRELPFQLAKVTWGDETGVFRFVNEWGLLSISHVENSARSAPQGTSPAPSVGPPADRLDFIWGHAKNARIVLGLLHAIRNDDRQGLASILKDILVYDHQGENGPAGIMKWQQGKTQAESGYYHMGNVESPAFAEQVIGMIISQGKGFTIQMEGLKDSLAWYALIDTVYWHLKGIAQNGPVKQCEGCGGYFIQTDRRQRFCPPSEDQIKLVEFGSLKRAQSPCAVRERMRRYNLREGSDNNAQQT